MGIKITGMQNLNRMFKSLESIQTDGLADKVANRLAEEGSLQAKFNYATTATSGINVVAIPAKDGVSYIQASGDGLAYIEFGTGRVGERDGYPADKRLKLGTLTFVSPSGKEGKQHSTQGWEYYYKNEDTKVTVNGKEGWYFGKTFTEGQPAGKQLYDTYKYLEEHWEGIAYNELKGGIKWTSF